MTEQTPSLALVNGRIVTVDRDFTIVEAVAIAGERIIARGDNATIGARCAATTTIVDLDGRTVLPGLIDSHCHVEDAGLAAYTVAFDGVGSIDEMNERIAELSQRTPAGEWIRGQIWHPLTQLAEKRFPTRQEIDRATGTHPVVLPVGHFTLANSMALARAGIDRNTPDPVGGEIGRDERGDPTGVLAEAAEKLVADIVPWWSDAVRREQLKAAQAHFNAFGLTGAVSGAVRPSDAALLRHIVDDGEATLRLGLMLSPSGELNPSLSLAEWQAFFDDLGAPFDQGDPWLTHAAVKLQIDGGMTLRTAAMREAYPGDPAYFGMCVVAQERLDQLVAVANRAGWRVGVHAVGDAGIDMVLDAFAAADAERSIRDRRFILVHASLMQPDQMERARRLGVRADVQSVFLWSKTEMIRTHLGDAVADRAIPLRQMIDIMGIDHVASGTDYPINPLNPFINIYLMVTRKDRWGRTAGADQAITREEAIRLYTSAAARYTFAEDQRGTIEPGKLADLVVLSDDILSVDEDRIRDIVAEMTIVGGRIVFERMASKSRHYR